MDTNTKVFGDKGLAPGAALCCTSWVNFDIHPTSLFRFVLDALSKLSPSYITNASIHTTPVTIHHVLDLQLLDSNDAKLVNQLPCFLVDKVMPPVSYPFVDTGYDFLGLSSLRRSLIQFRQLSLSFNQRLPIYLKETRVWNFLTCRKSGEGGQPNIDAHGRIAFRQWLSGTFNSKTNIPFAGRLYNRTGLDIPKDGSMEFGFNTSYLSELKAALFSCEPKLSIGKTIVSVIALKARVAGFLLSCLHPPEEALEALIQPISYILKYLGVGIFQARALRFKFRYPLALFEIRKPFLSLFPTIPAFLKQLIIEPTTFIKLTLKQSGLMFSRVESVFKGFIHHHLVYLKGIKISTGKEVAHSSPALKYGAF